MKADQITQPGHYWYRVGDGAWDVVSYDGQAVRQMGALIRYVLTPANLPGEFVGPIATPEPTLVAEIDASAERLMRLIETANARGVDDFNLNLIIEGLREADNVPDGIGGGCWYCGR